MFNAVNEHAKVPADIDQGTLLVVKLDLQPALVGLADLRDGGSGIVIDRVAVDDLDLVRDSKALLAGLFVHLHVSDVCLPLHGLANVAEPDLGEFAKNHLLRNGGTFSATSEYLGNARLNAVICCQSTGVSAVRRKPREGVSFVCGFALCKLLRKALMPGILQYRHRLNASHERENEQHHEHDT